MFWVYRSSRWLRVVAVAMASAAVPVPIAAGAQDQTEYRISADEAGKQARKLAAEDAKLVRLLRERVSDLALDNYHVSAVEDLLKGWRTYSQKECELIGEITGGAPVNRGTYAQMCVQRRYAARATVIGEVLRCLLGELKKTEDERRAPECLTTLTPLMTQGDYGA